MKLLLEEDLTVWQWQCGAIHVCIYAIFTLSLRSGSFNFTVIPVDDTAPPNLGSEWHTPLCYLALYNYVCMYSMCVSGKLWHCVQKYTCAVCWCVRVYHTHVVIYVRMLYIRIIIYIIACTNVKLHFLQNLELH